MANPNDPNGRVKAFMESDFVPASQPGVSAENRIALALEYIAYQLGQINRKLDATNAAKAGPSLDEQIAALHKL